MHQTGRGDNYVVRSVSNVATMELGGRLRQAPRDKVEHETHRKAVGQPTIRGEHNHLGEANRLEGGADPVPMWFRSRPIPPPRKFSVLGAMGNGLKVEDCRGVHCNIATAWTPSPLNAASRAIDGAKRCCHTPEEQNDDDP